MLCKPCFIQNHQVFLRLNLHLGLFHLFSFNLDSGSLKIFIRSSDSYHFLHINFSNQHMYVVIYQLFNYYTSLIFLYMCVVSFCLTCCLLESVYSLQVITFLIGEFYRKQSYVVSGIEYYGFRFIVYF